MLTIGESRATNMVVRMLGNDKIDEIDDYVKSICERDFMVMNSAIQIREVFKESLENFIVNLSDDEALYLRSYTGLNFKYINAILRGLWSYDENGSLTPEMTIQSKVAANKIQKAVSKFESPSIDFISFRGVTLSAFQSYGIDSFEKLNSLKGKFLYESGFVSTSLIEKTSYFDNDLIKGEKRNIEIRYLIGSDCNDGALLIDDSTTFSVNQNEFLINSGSLFKVIEVNVDTENQKAFLTVVLIPKKVYDKDYEYGVKK